MFVTEHWSTHITKFDGTCKVSLCLKRFRSQIDEWKEFLQKEIGLLVENEAWSELWMICH